jgi:thymidylate synthase (FAD)
MPEVAEMLTRDTVPELDAVLGQVFTTYDKGFVRVTDYMGAEAGIVRAARVSYGKGTKTKSDDRGLIRYLLRHSHTTPFEMLVIQFHVRVPMDTWRQWIRHRMSSVNEYSTRYSEAIDDKAVTLPGEWRFQSATNKQGSGEFLHEDVGRVLTAREASFHKDAADVYSERLDAGVAREQARKDLPLSTYTEAYWKIDLHNLLHFLSLRLDTHAQREIRTCAGVIHEIVKLWVPNVYEAFEDYNFRRQAILLTRLDTTIVHALAGPTSLPVTAMKCAEEFGWLEKRGDGSLKDNRERVECEAKLAKLGLKAPWKD